MCIIGNLQNNVIQAHKMGTVPHEVLHHMEEMTMLMLFKGHMLKK